MLVCFTAFSRKIHIPIHSNRDFFVGGRRGEGGRGGGLQSRLLKQLYTIYIDRTYLMYLTVPFARADRIQTGIKSVLYMNVQYIRFMYPFGYLRTYIYQHTDKRTYTYLC